MRAELHSPSLRRAAGAKPAHIIGVVKLALAKVLGAERGADEDKRGALDRRLAQRADDFAKRRAHDPLVRP